MTVAIPTAARIPGATQASPPSPTSSSAYQTAEQTVYSDLNSGNYTGAWNTALGTSDMFGSTNMSQTTQDPLVAALESSQGLQSFDPTKTWNPSSLDAYYAAFNSTQAYHGNNTGNNGYLGKNPYGNWGNASAITSGSDQAANIAQEGDTPDVERFVGARPTQSFLSKYGASLAALALTAVTAGAAAPLAGAVLGGTTALDVGLAGAAIGTAGTAAIDAGFGKPITAGSLAGGALNGVGASGALGGLGNAVGSATGLGSTAGGSLVGAGVGAAGSALNHGNIALGALGGAASGAIKGSGIGGQAGSAINNATGIPTGLATGAVNAGLGVGTGLAINSLASAAQPQNSASGVSGQPQSGATQMGSNPFSGVGNIGAVGAGTGNTSNMGTSTDSSLASTIGGLLGGTGGLLQAGAGTAGSLAAANAESNADQNAITTQQNNLGNINNIWAAQQQTGQGANTALQSSLGLNGQTANPSNFLNMPGYQFAVQQGTQAIQRQAAAMGNAYTPNTAAAVGQYVTGTASQDYNTYISQLMSSAGLGSTANTALQTGSQQSSNNISQLQQNIGQAQAMGYTGVANAAGGLFGNNGAGTGLVNSLFGSGGGSSGGSGSSGVGSGSSADQNLYNENAGDTSGSQYSAGFDASGNAGYYDSSGNLIQAAPGTSAAYASGNFGGGLNYGGDSTPSYLPDFTSGDFTSDGFDTTSLLGGDF